MTDTKEVEKAEEEKVEVTTTVFDIGEGPVRMGINIGVTMEYAPQMWLKPGVYLEVPMPEGADLDTFRKEFLGYVLKAFEAVEDANITKGLEVARTIRPVKEKSSNTPKYGKSVSIPSGPYNG